ncbi:MAG: GDP-mannose 4,6-dehydratase [Candidatus Binatia bacterium]
MRALITGVSGFCGSHLAQLLLEKGFEVAGLVREETKLESAQDVLDRVRIFKGDVRRQDSIVTCLSRVQPHRVYHLAALTSENDSGGCYKDLYETNVQGTINLLESVRALGIDPVIHIACSSAEYGLVTPDECPITEQSAFRPLTHYAVSKVAQDMLGYQYSIRFGLKIVRTRAFNIVGPRQSDRFVCSTLARQVAEIEEGFIEPLIRVGNLTSRRDFVDVRDAVRGYWLVSEQGENGQVYNVCSGQAWSIRQVLDMLLRLTEVDIRVEHEAQRVRRHEIPIQIGDCSKLSQQTGWRPAIDLGKTLQDLLDFWRQRTREGNPALKKQAFSYCQAGGARHRSPPSRPTERS